MLVTLFSMIITILRTADLLPDSKQTANFNVSLGAALTGVSTPRRNSCFCTPQGESSFHDTPREPPQARHARQSWVTASAAGMFSTLAANLIPLLALLSVTESVLFSPRENYHHPSPSSFCYTCSFSTITLYMPQRGIIDYTNSFSLYNLYNLLGINEIILTLANMESKYRDFGANVSASKANGKPLFTLNCCT